MTAAPGSTTRPPVFAARGVSKIYRMGDVEVHALRIGDLPECEEFEGVRVHRHGFAPAPRDVFHLYEPPFFAAAVDALARIASGIDGPVEAHGYETGEAARVLRRRGVPVLPVLHYLVAQETVHDLAVGDDPDRRRSFQSPLAVCVGRACPEDLRPSLVRNLGRVAPWAALLPGPKAVSLQFHKLSLERTLLEGEGPILAVGASFARSVGRLYPCRANRLRWCFAGAPEPVVPGRWPLPARPGVRRLVMVGRPTGQKGWDYAAEALHRLEAHHPKEAARVEVTILGGLGDWGGPWSSYSATVRRRFDALRTVRVACLGPADHDAVLATLSAGHALLLPSVFEPFGLVMLEALASRCLVIASDADGPADVLRPPWGIRVPFSRPRERVGHLLTGIRALLSLDDEALRHAADEALAAARSFRWSDCARVHLRVLAECVGDLPAAQSTG